MSQEKTTAESERVIVRCSSCSTKNRIDLQKALRARPKCARCHEPLQVPEPQTGPLEVTDGTFEQLVSKSPVPVFLEFYSPYCIYCQKLEPFMRRLATEASRRLRVAKLNIDLNRYTASQFQVQGTPTFVLFDGGREIDRVPGAVPEEHLRYRLHRFLS